MILKANNSLVVSKYIAKRFNSLAPGRSECDSKTVIFYLVLLMGILRSSHDNALQWIPQDLTDDKSTLVQVMAWCRQATSHYLSSCWPSSMTSLGHSELNLITNSLTTGPPMMISTLVEVMIFHVPGVVISPIVNMIHIDDSDGNWLDFYIRWSVNIFGQVTDNRR